MKTIFKEITARLDTIAELNWVDEDKGQMNFQNPRVSFPAALVTLSIPNAQNITQKLQDAQLGISVKLCFDFMGNTNSVTPDVARDKSLAYYDMVDKVYNTLQGWSGTEFNALENRNFGHIPRPDGYKTVVMSFGAAFHHEVTE